jgi:hypothetical protein
MPAELQLSWVLRKGTFLMWRQEQAKARILYHLPDGGRGFFVELGVDEEQTHFYILRSFVSSEPLEDYAHGVGLPNLGP